VPSRLADNSEILALADEVGAAGRGIVQATIGPGLFLNEFEEIAGRTGRPVTWTALLAGAFGPAEANRKLLQRTARVLETGRRVIPQVSCRPLNFEYDFVEPFLFEQMPLFAELARVDGAGRRARLASGEFRARFRAELPPFLAGWTQRTVFSWSPLDRALEERPLEAVAAERGADPVDLALDLALQNDLRLRLRTAASNYDEAEVGELLADRNTVVALSDAGAHAAQLCDACYSTHLLGHWVRDKGVLPLERAIHMLTGQPAELLGLTSRGRLAPGLAADVVVFDPATVGAGPLRRVNDLPGGAERLVADASGIEAVLVNGTILRRANRDTVDPEGALPGGLLRNLPQ
jgi:N-acyl-D-aspartate/D-glutamate deacylase